MSGGRGARNAFGGLAAAHGLEVREGTSPEGSPERYLYSPDMVFRYAFGRWWGADDLATTAVWVLLNPATGDTERRPRPTLARCIARSKALGDTGLLIVNLFAYRHTDPRKLRTASDVVAWGSHGSLHGRSAAVGPLLSDPMCLGAAGHGEPRHPLYVAADARLVPWTPPGPEDRKVTGLPCRA